MPERTIGNYVLGPLLGRGGMSEVYAAEHRFLGDRVAIKLLRAHLANDPDSIAGFLAEATRTRAIEHGNVVRVLDFGSHGEDCYLVMERLEGESLGARIVRDGPLPEAEVRRLGAAIADGVAAAHARGIVHRDLKPANVMLAGDTPKIVDFGIARAFGGGAAAVTGSRVGSIAYMAPEQITEGALAPSVDIWALGVILYEALAGRLPFEDFANGKTPQLVEPPPRLGTQVQVSPDLEALIAACLQRDPARRPPAMREVAAQLRQVSDQRFTEDVAPVRAASVSHRELAPATTQRLDRARRRNVRIAQVAVIATLGFVAAAVGWRWAASAPASIEEGVRAAPTPDVPPTPAPAAAPAPTASAAAATPTPTAISASAVPTPAAPVAAPPTAAPAGFTVEVRSTPGGASVTVDGMHAGVTPTTIALAVPASIVVTRPGYRPWRTRANRAGPISVRLVPLRRIRPPAAGETLD